MSSNVFTVILCIRDVQTLLTLDLLHRWQISSFRVAKTSAGLRKMLDAVHKQIRDEERDNMAAQADNGVDSEVTDCKDVAAKKSFNGWSTFQFCRYWAIIHLY